MPDSRCGLRRSQTLAVVAGASLLLLAYGASQAAVPPPVDAVHAHLACSSCHPTEGDPPGPGCTTSSCHQAEAGAFATSLHDRRNLTGPDHGIGCADCHVIHSAGPPEGSAANAPFNRTDQRCLGCHESVAIRHPSESLPRAPEAPGEADHTPLAAEPGCADCHGRHGVVPSGDPASATAAGNVATTCGRCHVSEASEYAESTHAREVAAGDPLAPTCVTCHGFHSVAASPPGEAAATCASCHDDPDVLHRTGLSRAPVESFRRSFHGLALAHGVSDVATCTSCHGAHLVVSSSDPRSPISPSRLRSTCGACHPRATPRMLKAVTGSGIGSHLSGAVRLFEVDLPIARTRVNLLAVALVGGAVGFLSVLFGIGGGFLMPPLLVLLGLPGAVAAASNSAQITATAASGARTGLRRSGVDARLSLVVAAAGILGSVAGVRWVLALRTLGIYEPILRVLYALVLVGLGAVVLSRSRKPTRTAPRKASRPTNPSSSLARLPLQTTFATAGVTASWLVLIATGATVGVLAAVLGVGGGFLVLPLLIYGLGVPTRLAVGTTSLSVAVISATVTLQQAAVNHTVDLVLAGVLFLGCLLGSRVGLGVAPRFRRDRVRLLLGIGVIVLAAALLVGMTVTPASRVLLGVAP